MNPYSHLHDYQFWSKSVTASAPGQLNPVAAIPFRIGSSDKIASLGSCFAQNITRQIQRAGFNYLIAEPAPSELTADEARRKNYGVYSARYGNVYTAKQALQLFDRAFGEYQPRQPCWQKGTRWVDPFRPQIEPDGFASEQQALEDQARHLNAVRQMFLEADWLIFTLGLTETWRSKINGAVFPLAPGVAGGVFDPVVYEFVNFHYSDVVEDLLRLRNKIQEVNVKAKLLLTVSPVPLIATYENRHVLVSTCASKAILRAATDEVERRCDNVFYFPAYEIIHSPSAEGRYFEDDLRNVNSLGVNHVMRVFFRQCCEQQAVETSPHSNQCAERQAQDELQKDLEIMCDEALIGQSQQLTDLTDFDEQRYLALNPDVAQALQHGYFESAFQHYQLFGRFENRPV